MDKRTDLQSTLRIEDVPTVRSRVAQKLREAIMSGTLKPGQRLVERELCEMTGVSRPSIREALRLLEADGLVTTVPHRGPVVSTISLEEAKQLYAARAVLEGFAGRECARLRDPAVVRRIGDALVKLKAAFAEGDLPTALEAKTEFYAALIGGCQNVFVERMLQAAARPDHAVANYLDVAAETDQQEPARGYCDLARDPERRPRTRRAMLRRSYQGGGGGRAQHDRTNHPQ